MKALTLHQPWASLMILLNGERPYKMIETRSWWTNVREDVAIHAAKTVPTYARWFYHDSRLAQHVLKPLGITTPRHLDELPRGVIVGVTDLFHCSPTNSHRPGDSWKILPDGRPTTLSDREPGTVVTCPHPIRDSFEHEFGNYGPDRFMWFTRNMRALDVPVPCSGGQRFWNVPADVEAHVLEQLRGIGRFPSSSERTGA